MIIKVRCEGSISDHRFQTEMKLSSIEELQDVLGDKDRPFQYARVYATFYESVAWKQLKNLDLTHYTLSNSAASGYFNLKLPANNPFVKPDWTKLFYVTYDDGECFMGADVDSVARKLISGASLLSISKENRIRFHELPTGIVLDETDWKRIDNAIEARRV